MKIKLKKYGHNHIHQSILLTVGSIGLLLFLWSCGQDLVPQHDPTDQEIATVTQMDVSISLSPHNIDPAALATQLEPWEIFPLEIWEKVFSYLNGEELARMQQVKKYFHEFINTPYFTNKYFPTELFINYDQRSNQIAQAAVSMNRVSQLQKLHVNYDLLQGEQIEVKNFITALMNCNPLCALTVIYVVQTNNIYLKSIPVSDHLEPLMTKGILCKFVLQGAKMDDSSLASFRSFINKARGIQHRIPHVILENIEEKYKYDMYTEVWHKTRTLNRFNKEKKVHWSVYGKLFSGIQNAIYST